jgi:hypothetical protein
MLAMGFRCFWRQSLKNREVLHMRSRKYAQCQYRRLPKQMWVVDTFMHGETAVQVRYLEADDPVAYAALR